MSANKVPVSVMNNEIIHNLQNGGTEKVAAASTEMTRTQLREDAFVYGIFGDQVMKATDDMLIRSVALNGQNVIPAELEPDSPGAKYVPLQTVPEGEYIQGSMYEIPMARIMTKEYKKDVDELRSFKTDLRKVLIDNAIKDGQAELDGKFISTVNSIVEDTVDPSDYVTPTGAPGDLQRITGKVQWIEVSGGLTRVNYVEARKLMAKGSSFPDMENKYVLKNGCALMHINTGEDFLKWGRDEFGGDGAQEGVDKGLVRDNWFGLKTIFTIKAAQVPENRIYFFAEPEFLGKFYYLTDWTMYVKTEGVVTSSYATWYGGFAIANLASCVRVDFV